MSPFALSCQFGHVTCRSSVYRSPMYAPGEKPTDAPELMSFIMVDGAEDLTQFSSLASESQFGEAKMITIVSHPEKGIAVNRLPQENGLTRPVQDKATLTLLSVLTNRLRECDSSFHGKRTVQEMARGIATTVMNKVGFDNAAPALLALWPEP